MALPSFAPGGPMPRHQGELLGRAPDAEERAAAALLYVAVMIDVSLDLIHSDNTVIIDGGLNADGLLASLLAALRPDQAFMQGATLQGSAVGAAELAFESRGCRFAANVPELVRAVHFAGLDRYRDNWRCLVSERVLGSKEAGGVG